MRSLRFKRQTRQADPGLLHHGRIPPAAAPWCIYGWFGFTGLLPAPLGVSPVSALPEARNPVSGRSGIYLFPPFGLGLCSLWNDRCVKEVFRPFSRLRPPLHFVDFVDDLRLVEGRGARNRISVGMAWLMDMSPKVGVRFHAKDSRRQGPPWLGFPGWASQ